MWRTPPHQVKPQILPSSELHVLNDIVLIKHERPVVSFFEYFLNINFTIILYLFMYFLVGHVNIVDSNVKEDTLVYDQHCAIIIERG